MKFPRMHIPDVTRQTSAEVFCYTMFVSKVGRDLRVRGGKSILTAATDQQALVNVDVELALNKVVWV